MSPAPDCDGGQPSNGPALPVLSVTETLLAVAMAPPGGRAISLLESLRGRDLTEDDRLAVVQLWQPQLAWISGAEHSAVLDLVGAQPAPTDRVASLADEFVPLEIAAALTMSVDQARAKIRSARLLAGELKPTGDLLRAGVLDPYRAWLVTDTLTELSPDATGEVQAKVLPRAAGLTPAQLRRALRKAAREADPQWGEQMFAAARKSRRVGFDKRSQDGLVLMYAYLPAVEATAAERHLHLLAGEFDPADGRSKDERMADALLATLLGSEPGRPNVPLRPQVRMHVLMPLSTLLGLRASTAELVGYGDLPAGLARELAEDADFQRWIHEDITGHLIDQGRFAYTPRKRLSQFVRARDRHCRFPGSGRSAFRADLDHSEPFDRSGHGNGGATSAANLAALSRYVHRAKTHGGFRLRHDPDGTITWTTPLGRHYQTRPHDYRPDSDKP